MAKKESGKTVGREGFLQHALNMLSAHLTMIQLPIIEIGGTQFFVDLRMKEFTQVDNPFNKISFAVLEETKTGLTFLYDPIHKNVFKGVQFELEHRTDLLQVQLPSLQQMDPIRCKQLRQEEFYQRKKKR